LLPKLRGTTLAGAEFGTEIPGTFGTTYTYPTPAEIDYFSGKGLNAIRVPFLWERLQRSLNGAFEPDELARLDAVVAAATGKGMFVIVDPHNFARYGGQLIGSADVPRAAFYDFWSKLAAHYAANPKVVLAVMNEPYGLPAEDWLMTVNGVLPAIRQAGAQNLVLVPGVQWTGAHSWLTENAYGTPNGTVMTGVVDPGQNFAIEVHQYLDADSSGTSPTCVSPTIGAERIAAFTSWAKQHGLRAMLGEFGGSVDDTCLQAMDNLLSAVDASPEVWIGWSYWAAGPWWGDYMFTLEPTPAGADRAQLAILQKH
jgi:endoglucanase